MSCSNRRAPILHLTPSLLVCLSGKPNLIRHAPRDLAVYERSLAVTFLRIGGARAWLSETAAKGRKRTPSSYAK